MFEKCLRCGKLGSACPRQLYELSPEELVALCNTRRKNIPGMTYDRMVEKTNLSKGTISGFFGGNHADYRLDTIRPILKVLFGEKVEGCLCASLEVGEREAYEEKIKGLERDLKWQEERTGHFVDENKRLRQELVDQAEHHKENKSYLKEKVREKNRTIAALGCLLGVALAYIVWTIIASSL